METTKPIVRIAPSPTGYFHLGTARTALFNYLYARHTGGTFIVRVEDTDRERSKPEFEQDILEGLAWLGLSHDAFYRQSERGEIYREHLQKLLTTGAAYVSKEIRKDTGAEGEVIRFKNPGKTITFIDTIRGEISFDTKELGDFVIAKSEMEPLYHLAVVIDDFTMGVTHVIRGEDHISNTPRQILIQEALGAPRPSYTHLPLILGTDRSKLSKRHGAQSVREYKDQGYVPEAINNFLALMGWHPGTDVEIFTKQELIELFSLERLQKSGAIFNVEKLQWLNREHLKRLSDDEFSRRIAPHLPDGFTSAQYWNDAMFQKVLPVLRDRITVLDDIAVMAAAGDLTYYFVRPALVAAKIPWKGEGFEDAARHLQKVEELLRDGNGERVEDVRATLMPYAEVAGKGSVLWPVRYVLSGKEQSPDPFTLISMLGVQESIVRIGKAIDLLARSS